MKGHLTMEADAYAVTASTYNYLTRLGLDLTRLRKDFTNHRANAKRRGIAFEISYPEWLELWIASGKLTARGRGRGKFVMARHGDKGSYSAENCSIVEWLENLREPQAVEAKREACSIRMTWRSPLARPCVDPDGIEWPSAAMAANAAGERVVTTSWRARHERGGWSYAADRGD
jgi:hypothetical protein